jgi:hypothetical protein
MSVHLTEQPLDQFDHDHHHHRLDWPLSVTLGHSWNAQSVVSILTLKVLADY